MTNLNINQDFTVHPRAKAPRIYCEGYRLADVYGNYSTAKETLLSIAVSFVKSTTVGVCV